jgi:crotonobetainyl-CoA:carnitine CoA-transferase CaiB-like acyl-CoA transferase
MNMQTGNRRALSGVRVLDLGRVLAAPYAAQLLADLGAEVIKIERPGRGDDARSIGPPFLRDRDGADTRETPMHLCANRNKKSITIDLAKPAGQQLLRRLASVSDVLIENYKVGDLARYGLDYASLRELNPRLVYCSITGFGQSGPYRHRPGYDAIFQAMSGLMSVTGNPDHEPGGGPVKVGPSIVDVITGLFASNAILAALHWREGGGSGQYIDMALLDSAIASLSHYLMTYFVSGEIPVRRGTEGNGGMPGRMFDCADGQIMIVAGNDEQYYRLCGVLGTPELASDPRFLRNSGRVEHRALLTPLINAATRRIAKAELLGALDGAGVPAGPVNDFAQVFADPQVVARALELSVPHPLSGMLQLVRSPMVLSETPISEYAAPPLLGAHTDEVLGGLLGLDARDRAALREAGAI